MPPALPRPQPRSVFVTILGWGVIGVSALGIPISVISGLMLVAGSYGTSTGGIFGWLTVLGGPLAAVVAGIGLLRRQRWARYFLLALLFAVLAYNGYEIFEGPTPESTYTSAAGVRTTVLASEGNYSLPIIAVCSGLVVMLFSQKVRSEFGHVQSNRVSTEGPDMGSGWRVGHQGRDSMYYEEWRDGAWQRIRIDGEMLTGRAHHVIYFASPETWQAYPQWARFRRDEIMARIQTQFREPDYEYHGASQQGTPPSSSPGVAAQRGDLAPDCPLGEVKSSPARRGGVAVKLQWIAAFVAVVGLMVWLVLDGLETGETKLPVRFSSQIGSVSRVEEPTQFWLALGLYAAIGIATGGLGVWSIIASRRDR